MGGAFVGGACVTVCIVYCICYVACVGVQCVLVGVLAVLLFDGPGDRWVVPE